MSAPGACWRRCVRASAGGDLAPLRACVEEGAGGGLRALESVMGSPSALDLVGGRHLLGREQVAQGRFQHRCEAVHAVVTDQQHVEDRKSTRLNSSHVAISYAVFCLKK